MPSHYNENFKNLAPAGERMEVIVLSLATFILFTLTGISTKNKILIFLNGGYCGGDGRVRRDIVSIVCVPVCSARYPALRTRTVEQYSAGCLRHI